MHKRSPGLSGIKWDVAHARRVVHAESRDARPKRGRDPGENCGLSRPARLARSCTASRGYARGKLIGYVRGSRMRGYARGKIIDAWRDPDAEAPRRALHHGPGSRGPERSRARRRVAHARRVVRAEIESRGPESPAPAGSRARNQGSARGDGDAHARRVVHAADWATRASDCVVHAERDSGGNSKLETAASDRWRQPSPLAGPAYRSGPGPSKLLSLGTRVSRRRNRLT